MDLVHKEINRLIVIGESHDSQIRLYAIPQLEEKLAHIAMIRSGFGPASVDATFKSVHVTLKSRVELVERENGLLAVWAQRELAEPILFSLLGQKRDDENNQSLAFVSLQDLKQEIATRDELLYLVEADDVSCISGAGRVQ